MPNGVELCQIIHAAWINCDNKAPYYEEAKRGGERCKDELAHSKSGFQRLLDAVRSTGQSDDGPTLEVLRSVAVEEGQLGSSRQESWLARIINKVVAPTRPLTQKQQGQGWIPGSINPLTGEPVSRVAARSSCSRCGTTNTPQWREGPCGGSTLCHACGQRWVHAGKPGQQEKQEEVWITPESVDEATGELVSRVDARSSCSQCNKTGTILQRWRTGPFGFGTLCNACGLRWGKVVKQEKQQQQQQQQLPQQQQPQQQQQQQEPYRRSSKARVKRKRDDDDDDEETED